MTDNRGFYGGGTYIAGEGAYWQNAYDRRSDRGRAFFDATHNFSIGGTWDLPVGTGRPVGNGMSKETRMGPIHIGSQRQEVEEQVEDAKARGGKVLFGGERPKGGDFDKGFFYLPTLMTNVPEDSRLTKEEVFGPALPVYTFKTLDEALEKANSSEFGLGSSIWTRNLLHANKAIDKLQAGNVWVNSLHYGYDELPFGGVKSSGVGREHGPEALDYYLEPKGVVIVNV